jgi:steroid delta-isomerase-like uncharacterized protein
MKRIFRPVMVAQGVLLLLSAHYVYAQSNKQTASKQEQQMDTETRNKAVVRHMYEDILNTGRLDLLSEVIGDRYIGTAGEKGPEGAARSVGAVLKAFPDIKWRIEDLLADGDKVAVRWTWEGTHTGKFQDYPVTGNKVHANAMVIYRLADGKIINAHMLTDRLGFLQQIGVASKELGAPPKKQE